MDAVASVVWFQILGYFVAWSFVFIGVFTGYAKLLRFVARCSNPFRPLLGLGIYLVIACILVLPLGGLAVNGTWHLAVSSSTGFSVLFLLGYLLSLFPGAMYFKRQYLDELQRLGYFKSRSLR